MTYLDPSDNRQEALDALSAGMEYDSKDYRASTERRAIVFALLDVAAAIRETNQKPIGRVADCL